MHASRSPSACDRAEAPRLARRARAAPVHPVLAWQRSAGNQAVAAVLRSALLPARAQAAPGTEAASTGDSGYDFLREHVCVQQPDPSRPQRTAFSSRERARAVFGLSNARSIASRAFMNLGHRDRHHLRMAERTFQRPVTFETLDSHVVRIRDVLNRLTLDQNVWASTCHEPTCNGNAPAWTLDDLSGIVLCPFYFTLPARALVTTFLHEAGHMANIDVHWAPGNEVYCRNDDAIECDDICPISGQNLLENVDAWARLIYCLAMSS